MGAQEAASAPAAVPVRMAHGARGRAWMQPKGLAWGAPGRMAGRVLHRPGSGAGQSQDFGRGLHAIRRRAWWAVTDARACGAQPSGRQWELRLRAGGLWHEWRELPGGAWPLVGWAAHSLPTGRALGRGAIARKCSKHTTIIIIT
jgi:hypothetical protein